LDAQEDSPLLVVHAVTFVDDDNERAHRSRRAAVTTPWWFTSIKIAIQAGRFSAPLY
jgi:hypothetical protein